ncbi:hypothetical protein FGG79_12155 [Bacillus sp. BHET2]|uniref:hypothetical protein n=1 Tax=Bacillus sp. BHET2 TaxID=2583818 RepID=UPI00110E0ED7|nr:hypothetical protein [Bacillus sp. BHET2]TMU85939.1 hypothetical protein FGG79_12155 [Bacillus sp. BHET2]
MKKYLPIFITVLLILGACADKTLTNEKEATSSDQDKSTTETKQEKDKETESKEQRKQPYKPLEPSEDAVSLKETLTKEDQPDKDGQDGEPQRTVPLGETLANGMDDPSDGPLKDHRLVTYYGTPVSEHMGILGKLEPEEYIKKLKEQTQVYSDLDPERPAVPTIELITTMAQNAPGKDGDYVRMTAEENIETYVELAEKHDALVLLDIQLGTDTVMNQVQMIEKWLKHPNVNLAIDTEFHVAEGEKPGEDLGQVDGRDIQEAVEYLSELTEKNNLPDKLVLVHQFTGPVLTHKDAIEPTDNVEVAINFDGWGAAADKQALYRKYIRDEPHQYGAFKIFYDKDEPVMKPEDVLKMDPSPAVINYQ